MKTQAGNTVFPNMTHSVRASFFWSSILLLSVFFCQDIECRGADKTDSDDRILNQYIQSKGSNVISFDASNIKRFWIDNSVVSRDNSIDILLKETNTQFHESVPLKIQLVNVSETQDCTVEVIFEPADCFFEVLSNKTKVLSSSKTENNFIDYAVASSRFHLEDTPNFTFELKFSSNKDILLSIKKIILSFSENKECSFLTSPGVLKINSDNIMGATVRESDKNASSFSVNGKRIKLFSTYKIFTMGNTLSSSVKIKNIGNTDTRVYVGYAMYAHNSVLIDSQNYPYKNNKSLSVISVSDDNKKIVVNSTTDWIKKCYLVLNAKDDFSDIPNVFVCERIADIKKLENGQAEITLDAPSAFPIKKGDKVRVHGTGGAYLYENISILHPGEEQVFKSEVRKDDDSVEYTPDVFPKGSYYVIPLILSFSSNPNEENTVLISDFTISY